jgi:hypothetical protein
MYIYILYACISHTIDPFFAVVDGGLYITILFHNEHPKVIMSWPPFQKFNHTGVYLNTSARPEESAAAAAAAAAAATTAIVRVPLP